MIRVKPADRVPLVATAVGLIVGVAGALSNTPDPGGAGMLVFAGVFVGAAVADSVRDRQQ